MSQSTSVTIELHVAVASLVMADLLRLGYMEEAPLYSPDYARKLAVDQLRHALLAWEIESRPEG